MREAARHLMDEGRDRTAHGDLQRALEAYRSAHELMHVPTTGLALAKTHLALDQLAEAFTLASEVVNMPVEEGERPAITEAREKAKELRAELFDRVPKIQITFRGDPAKSLTVDDKEIALPLTAPVPVNPGTHTVVAVDPSGKELRERVDVQERETKKLELATSGEVKPKESPGEDHPPPPPEGETERTGTAKVLMIGGFALAGLGVAVGTVTGLMTSSKASTVKPQCDSNICDPAAKPDLDSALTLATVSTASFIAAGVGLGAGVVGLVLPKKHKDAAPTTGWNGLRIGPGTIGYQGEF
jgi:hypothetical protein